MARVREALVLAGDEFDAVERLAVANSHALVTFGSTGVAIVVGPDDHHRRDGDRRQLFVGDRLAVSRRLDLLGRRGWRGRRTGTRIDTLGTRRRRGALVGRRPVAADRRCERDDGIDTIVCGHRSEVVLVAGDGSERGEATDRMTGDRDLLGVDVGDESGRLGALRVEHRVDHGFDVVHPVESTFTEPVVLVQSRSSSAVLPV